MVPSFLDSLNKQTLKPRRSWTVILQILRDNGCQPRLLYPTKLSITTDREKKIFHEKNRFK